MVNLLKTFGKGILYVIGLPFFLVALAIFGVAGLFAFIVQLVMCIFYFFTGRKFFPDLPEDLELRALKEGPRADDFDDEEPIPERPINQQEQPRFIYPFLEQAAPMKEEPVNQDIPSEDQIEEEPIKEEEVVNTKEEKEINPFFFNDDSSKEETVDNVETVNTKEETVETEEEEEELETYVPHSSSFVAEDDTEEEGGVDIKYDL